VRELEQELYNTEPSFDPEAFGINRVNVKLRINTKVLPAGNERRTAMIKRRKTDAVPTSWSSRGGITVMIGWFLSHFFRQIVEEEWIAADDKPQTDEERLVIDIEDPIKIPFSEDVMEIVYFYMQEFSNELHPLVSQPLRDTREFDNLPETLLDMLDVPNIILVELANAADFLNMPTLLNVIGGKIVSTMQNDQLSIVREKLGISQDSIDETELAELMHKYSGDDDVEQT